METGLDGIESIDGGELFGGHLLAVDEKLGVEIRIEFVARLDVLGQAKDDHGGLFGAFPEVAAIAMIDEPESGFGKQGALGIDQAEETHGVGGGFRAIFEFEFEEGVVMRSPRGFALGYDGSGFEGLGNLFGAVWFAVGEEREAQHGKALSGHRTTLV